MSEARALAIIPSSYAEMQSISESFAKSSLLPEALRGKAADVFVQIAAGAELGLPPMAAIRGVHIFSGKPVLAADTMVAVVMGSGLAEYFMCVEETATSVTYETKRKGAPSPQRMTWSDADTKTAGLNTKENHRLHPRAMRKARCKSMLARDAYPDVLAGCYDPDEIENTTPRQAYTPPAADDAEIVEPTDVSDLLARITDVPDIDSLKSLAKEIADRKLTGDAKATVRAAYDAKSKLLKNPPVQNGHTAEVAQP